jgi:hypothetical protein
LAEFATLPGVKHKSIFNFLCLSLVAASLLPARATTEAHGPSPEIALENKTEKIEIARLRIENKKNGEISGSLDGGKTWQVVGHVLVPTTKTNPKGYNASKYGPPGTVVATAVNAIHLKAGQNTSIPTEKEGRGIIWTLSPAAEDDAGKASLQSEVSPGSAVYTDIPGGTGIFGGVFTPFVGNPITLDNNEDNQLSPLPKNYTPAIGDVWTITILRPLRYPRQIVFENRFGGLITIEYRDEKPRVIGQVLRPVLGVGRFVGSYFADVGRLRANHNGVIDISTSPREKIGSFQIVPADHAMSAETHYIRELTQWMVIGPVNALDPSWEGVAPLYSDFLRPRYDEDDWNYNVMDGLLGRFRFEVKKRGKTEWEPMPKFEMEPGAPLPNWAGTALSDVAAIRIRFPFTFAQPLERTPELPGTKTSQPLTWTSPAPQAGSTPNP